MKEDEQKSAIESRFPKSGILRFQLNRPRKSTSSVEFKDELLSPTYSIKSHSEAEPSSPQPSVDRLSVTFEDAHVHFDGRERIDTSDLPEKEEDDEDYSNSVNAILDGDNLSNGGGGGGAGIGGLVSRKCSWRRRSVRRSSSPYGGVSGGGARQQQDRRRSSVFTVLSGGSGTSAEEPTAQEKIFHRMKIHKEVLSQVKYQPWPMRKKMKLVQTAKAYIKRHEGALHERLAQKKSYKDIIEHINIIVVNQWHRFKREAANWSNNLVPWEGRIKEIESHFGSVVASYFTFLRWLFSVNLISALLLIIFVAVPEMLRSDQSNSGERKTMLPDEQKKSGNLFTLWNFEGLLKYSPFFYGYYSVHDANTSFFYYRIPVAYFITGLGVYIYSFVAILRKMAENSRQSKLSEKEDECTFSWKTFTGWDYMIGNPETAHNRTSSIILGFKELLVEEAEKNRAEGRNWKMTCVRIVANLGVVALLLTSVYAVVLVVERSNEPEANDSWWRQSEMTVVFNIIGFTYPIIFDIIGVIERYHPRKALRLQLARIMVLNLLTLYSFIFATFSKIDQMSAELRRLKPNLTVNGKSSTTVFTTTMMMMTSSTPATEMSEPCVQIPVACSTEAASLEAITTILATTTTTLGALMLSKSTSTEESISEDNYNFTSESTYDYGDNFNFTLNIENGTSETSTFSSYSTSFEPENFTTSIKSFSSNFSLTDDPENMSTTSYTIPTSELCFITRCPPEPHPPNGYTPSTGSFPNKTLALNIGATLDCPNVDLSLRTGDLDQKVRKKLRNLCWETMFGQDLVKLTVVDLLATIMSILSVDFFRALFVRLMNHCWCWDLEKVFPQYGDFKIAENILHLVNNQGMVWMGMFFSPLLPLINIVKLIIIMYMRSWAVLTCNVPHEVVFKASRSNNFYFALLLTMLFLCVLPVGYAVVWVEPSWHCGPFSNCSRIYHLFTTSLKKMTPKSLHNFLDYMASPGIVIPLLILLVLIIYYLVSLTNALREANNDLKIQLRRERTEERRKVYQLAHKRHRRGTEASDSSAPFAKWSRLLGAVPEGFNDATVRGERSSEKSNKTGGTLFGAGTDNKSGSDGKGHCDKMDLHGELDNKIINKLLKSVIQESADSSITSPTPTSEECFSPPEEKDQGVQTSDSNRKNSEESAWSNDEANIPKIQVEDDGPPSMAGASTTLSSSKSTTTSSSSSDTVVAVEGSSYEDIPASIKRIHSLTGELEKCKK